MRFRLLPTDEKFFGLFNDAAANAAECARRLRKILSDGEDRDYGLIIECERRGDELTRDIVAADRHVDDLMATLEGMAEAGLVGTDLLDARDRQLLVYVLRTAPELERSADLIEHIALRTPQRLVELISEDARELVAEMASIAASMWRDAADGFAARDSSVGARLRVRDQDLDDLHVDLTEELAASACGTAVAIEMGLVARFYERLGDHAVNVAHRAVNLVTIL